MVSDLIDTPTVRQRALPITAEQYHALGRQGLLTERVELLEGMIVEKMPKSPLHIFLVLAFFELLQKAVGVSLHVRSEQPLACQRSEPEPDVSVVRGKKEDYLAAIPQTAELVVEIAVSSADIDRRKATIYAEAGVREYWIVLPRDSPDRGAYETDPLALCCAAHLHRGADRVFGGPACLSRGALRVVSPLTQQRQPGVERPLPAG